jgi:hypothetical protein
MAIYKPDIRIFYGPSLTSSYRLIPAPNISISIEYNYSNDSIIGYTYIFNITGSATALDLRNINYGGSYTEPTHYNLGAVVDHIHKLRSILSQNGQILYVVDGATDSIFLQARGGILRSFSIDESNNNWTQFASYSASIEFSSVDFMSSTESCTSVFLDPLSFPSGKAGIVDINDFKIKSFDDSWSFDFGETEPYNRIKNIDSGSNLNINNATFNIQYTINAVGKHAHVYPGGSSLVVPAWEQAKNFAQYRLHSQVTNLINNVLKNPYTVCASSDGLDDVNVPGSNGLLSSLGDSSYKIFNEEITCETSESDGSFSATYNATVRSLRGNSSWSHPASTHTIEKSIQTINTNGSKIKTISLNGTIQGLIEGGLIRINKVLQLPSSGSITLLSNISDNKYTNAKIVLDKIYSDLDYDGGQGSCGKRDLKPNFKNILGITTQNLADKELPESACEDTEEGGCVMTDPPHPSSFNLTHDYINGTITYSIEYSSKDGVCSNSTGLKFNQITIQTNKPNKVIATFNIPNSYECPTIQELGTYTSKTVSVTISGTDSSCVGKPKDIDFGSLILCGTCDSEEYLPVKVPLEGSFILTQKQYTKNPVDGSFTINLGYICDTTGCNLDGTVGA